MNPYLEPDYEDYDYEKLFEDKCDYLFPYLNEEEINEFRDEWIEEMSFWGEEIADKVTYKWDHMVYKRTKPTKKTPEGQVA